ncbi:hypothetical protein R6Q59_004267 [Mikania micrantha]
MDISCHLPDSIMEHTDLPVPGDNNLSDYKKSVFLGYLNGTAAVPTLVTNGWSQVEWNFFNNQCMRMGYEPDYVVKDVESFMEDNLLDIQSVQPISDKKKQAIAAVGSSFLGSPGASSLMLVTVGFGAVYPHLKGGVRPFWLFSRLFRGWYHLMWKGDETGFCWIRHGRCEPRCHLFKTEQTHWCCWVPVCRGVACWYITRSKMAIDWRLFNLVLREAGLAGWLLVLVWAVIPWFFFNWALGGVGLFVVIWGRLDVWVGSHTVCIFEEAGFWGSWLKPKTHPLQNVVTFVSLFLPLCYWAVWVYYDMFRGWVYMGCKGLDSLLGGLHIGCLL